MFANIESHVHEFELLIRKSFCFFKKFSNLRKEKTKQRKIIHQNHIDKESESISSHIFIDEYFDFYKNVFLLFFGKKLTQMLLWNTYFLPNLKNVIKFVLENIFHYFFFLKLDVAFLIHFGKIRHMIKEQNKIFTV